MEGGDLIMTQRNIYILPEDQEYTGYSLQIGYACTTSEVDDLTLKEERAGIESQRQRREEGAQEKELVFPDTREEFFVDKSLREFYKKKGYGK
jgi:hypothetical protein